MKRCNLLDMNTDLLTNMLRETNQLDRRIFSDDQREEVIKELVEMNENCMNHSCFLDLLRSGCKGFDNFTDLELIEDIFQSYCPDMCEDEEFDGFGVYPLIESAVEKTRREVLCEAFEKHIT